MHMQQPLWVAVVVAIAAASPIPPGAASQQPGVNRPQGDGNSDVFMEPMAWDFRLPRKPTVWTVTRPDSGSTVLPRADEAFFRLQHDKFVHGPVLTQPTPACLVKSPATPAAPHAKGKDGHLNTGVVIDQWTKEKIWRLTHGHGPVASGRPQARDVAPTAEKEAPHDPDHGFDQKTKDQLASIIIQGGPGGRKVKPDHHEGLAREIVRLLGYDYDKSDGSKLVPLRPVIVSTDGTADTVDAKGNTPSATAAPRPT